MNREYTIISDSREKKPLVFPCTLTTLDEWKLPTSFDPSITVTIRTETECLGKNNPQMKKGDYFVKDYPDRCVAEKKTGVAEIAMNCLTKRPRERFIEELDYLRDKCRYPILLLVGSPASYMRKPKYRSKQVYKPGVAYSALIRLLMERNIWLLTMPGDTLKDRQAMGECVAHILISGTVTNEIPDQRPNSERETDTTGGQGA